MVTAEGDTLKKVIESTEPFLLVGMIAAVKQMLLIASFAARGRQPTPCSRWASLEAS